MELGRPFAHAVGETVLLEQGLGVSFTSVIGGSRCPSDVVCVREGNAAIAIDVAIADEDRA